MTTPILSVRILTLSLPLCALPLQAAELLIVVDDRGGTSALPYYEALNLQPLSQLPIEPTLVVPQPPATTVSEADMLPVRSLKLTPGIVARRTLEAPGLQPFFLVGDDATSRAWLSRHAATLQDRGAVGLVVNVETAEGLEQLRQIVPAVRLSPVPADDLADRLGLRHYPALVTSTGIEQ
uniref:integrating conjugative element protein n=1 Tax=Marinobacterium profundum TaxID=1714300 RepID=UPI0008318096|nr:integrating conjugative element protein [Marinobacterium profundum]